MGVDYSNMCGLGLKIPLQPLRKKVLVKVGKHDFDKSVRFHPKTGQPLWEERNSLPEDLAELLEDGDGEKEIEGLLFEVFTDGEMGVPAENLFVCVLGMSTGQNGRDRVEGQPLDEDDDNIVKLTRLALNKIFEPRGYWNDENYGFWSVMAAH